MTKDEQIEALTETNAYLLKELTQIASESMERHLALVRLQCEVQALKDKQEISDD